MIFRDYSGGPATRLTMRPGTRRQHLKYIVTQFETQLDID